MSGIIRLLAAISVFAALANPVATLASPAFPYQGVNLIAFNKVDFAPGPLLDRSLAYVSDVGANVILVDWMVAFNADGSIVPQSSPSSREPARPDILAIVERAHRLGLAVFLKPHIGFPDSFENRMHYNSDLAQFAMPRFFADWTNYLVALGEDAARTGVEGVIIGTEFTGFDANDCDRWSALIAKLRTAYDGIVGYNALFNVQSRLANVDRVCFWSEIDLIGLSLYVPLSKNDRAPLAELIAAWRNNPWGDVVDVIGYLQSLSSRFGKPVMAMEAGYQSAQGGLFDVGAIGTPRLPDTTVQVLGLTSMFEALRANRGPWLAGLSIWSAFPPYFDPTNQALGPWYAQGYMPNGKPGTDVIRKYYTSDGQYVPATEFYNQSLDHYFITHIPGEIEKLDSGTLKGWVRTGQAFKVYSSPQSGASAVCRIYIPPGKGDGHFFGRDQRECDGTMTANPTFILESATFMHLYLPNLGNCAAATVPVYRVFTNRGDANHRYTADRATRDQMVTKGWVAEGDGPDTVTICAPK